MRKHFHRRGFAGFEFPRNAGRIAAFVAALFGSLLPMSALHAATLYSFDATQGTAPQALISSRSGEVFGITSAGGTHGRGTVFRLSFEGKPEVLHDFSGDADGAAPTALIEGNDGILYGATTAYAQAAVDGSIIQTAGTLFAIRGRNFVTLTRAFSVPPLSGFLNPNNQGGPTALAPGPGGVLYGVTVNDGSGFGTLFRRDRDGTITILHTFSGAADGSQPNTLIEGKDGNVYGTTSVGGVGSGTVFRLAPNGTFTTLASLPALTAGSGSPTSLLMAENGSLYGGLVASLSSIGVSGAVFQVTPAGEASLLQRVGSSTTVGAQGPRVLLQSTDGNFYGTTFQDGAQGFGTLFRLTLSGALTTLYSFTGNTDGEAPNALAQLPGRGTMLLGTTSGQIDPISGVASFAKAGDYGSVFRWREPGGFETLFRFTYRHEFSPNSLVRGRGGVLYGTTAGDLPTSGGGSVFTVTPGGEVRTLHRFTGGDDGANPTSITEASDGNFYGRTSFGSNPDNSGGTLFRMTPEGGLTTLHSFAGNLGGQGSALVEGPDGNLYGSSPDATAPVFRLTLDGAYSVVGTLPLNGMFPPTVTGVLVGSDGALYGTTAGPVGPRSLNVPGTIFKMTLDGQLTTLAQVEGDPLLQFQGRDGRLYGTMSGATFQFGSGVAGSVFAITTQGQISTLFDFGDGSLGVWPNKLIETRDGDLLGTTLGLDSVFSSAADYGSAFRLTPDGTLTTLLQFHPTYAVNGVVVLAHPVALVEGPRGIVYGATLSGGPASTGSIFELKQEPEPATH